MRARPDTPRSLQPGPFNFTRSIAGMSPFRDSCGGGHEGVPERFMRPVDASGAQPHRGIGAPRARAEEPRRNVIYEICSARSSFLWPIQGRETNFVESPPA